MRDRIVVVGGGLVGLSCAWFLRERGAEVLVLERGEPGGGASRGNAGEICPSGVEPLPAPGMVAHAFANAFRADAAVHVHPSYAPRMAGFVARFAQASTAVAYERGFQAMLPLALGVTAAYDELAGAGIGTHARSEGYLVCFSDQRAAQEDREHVQRIHELGVCAAPEALLDTAEALALEPMLTPVVRAAYVLPGERWIDPGRFVDDLAAGLRERGVEIVSHAPVASLNETPDGIRARTDDGEDFDGGGAVLAAGVWSAGIAERLGLRLMMHPGKGYSFSVAPEPIPRRALNFHEAHVVMTPMGERLRVAGTMEFDGTTDRFNTRRIAAMIRGAEPFVQGIDWDARSEEWVGPRPMTPDGLPFIGFAPGSERIAIATGHNMLGLTLAPVTGTLIAGLLTGGGPAIDLRAFDPARFG